MNPESNCMRTKLLNTGSPSDAESPAGSRLPSIVVIYDDFSAGSRAIGALATLFPAPNDRARFRPALWRLDILEGPDGFSAALAEAIDAQIVVFSTSSSDGLSPLFSNWIALCLARKRGASAAVVALLGPEGSMDGPASPRLQFVHNAARKSGLAFFAPGPNEVDCAPATARPEFQSP
jgi:hypothetical protein